MPEIPGILSYSELGNNKIDYFPVEDISTDRSSVEVNKAFAAISMMSHTSIKAFVKFDLSSFPKISDGYTAWEAQWKSVTPTQPIVAKIGTGIFTVTFPSQVQDDRLNGELHTVVLKSYQASFGGLSIGLISCFLSSPNQVTVNVYTAAGALSDFTSGSHINLWVI